MLCQEVQFIDQEVEDKIKRKEFSEQKFYKKEQSEVVSITIIYFLGPYENTDKYVVMKLNVKIEIAYERGGKRAQP